MYIASVIVSLKEAWLKSYFEHFPRFRYIGNVLAFYPLVALCVCLMAYFAELALNRDLLENIKFQPLPFQQSPQMISQWKAQSFGLRRDIHVSPEDNMCFVSV